MDTISTENVLPQKKPRIEYIDLAKGFCITLVVMHHLSMFYEVQLPLSYFFKAFRMPLYFFLSGCFFKAYGGIWDFEKRKVNKLLIPFVFFYVVSSFLIPNILVHFGADIRHLPMSQLPIAFLGEEYPADQIWFLLSLFEINIIFYVIYLLMGTREHRTLLIALLTLLLGAIGVLFGVRQIDLPANLDSSLSALPFFAIGFIIFRNTDMLKPNRFDRYLPFMVMAAFLVVYFVTPNASFYRNRFYGNTWLTIYPIATLGVLGVLWLSKILKKLPVLSYYGRYSIIILVTHDKVFLFFSALLAPLNLAPSAELCLNLLLTISSYMLIIPFMRKYMPHVTAQKDVIPINK